MSFTCQNWKLSPEQLEGVNLYAEITDDCFGRFPDSIVIPETTIRVQYRESLYLNFDIQERIFRSPEGFSIKKITKMVQVAYLTSFPKRKDFDPQNQRHGGSPYLITLVPHDHKRNYYLAWIEHR